MLSVCRTTTVPSKGGKLILTYLLLTLHQRQIILLFTDWPEYIYFFYLQALTRCLTDTQYSCLKQLNLSVMSHTISIYWYHLCHKSYRLQMVISWKYSFWDIDQWIISTKELNNLTKIASNSYLYQDKNPVKWLYLFFLNLNNYWSLNAGEPIYMHVDCVCCTPCRWWCIWHMHVYNCYIVPTICIILFEIFMMSLFKMTGEMWSKDN